MRRLGTLGRAGLMQRPKGISDQISNYNFEEKKDFTKKYQNALEMKEVILQKLSLGKQEVKKANIKLDISNDLKGYYCWRNFNKLAEDDNNLNSLIPKGEFELSPKLMVEVFGLPNFTDETFEKNLGIFLFEDNF